MQNILGEAEATGGTREFPCRRTNALHTEIRESGGSRTHRHRPLRGKDMDLPSTQGSNHR